MENELNISNDPVSGFSFDSLHEQALNTMNSQSDTLPDNQVEQVAAPEPIDNHVDSNEPTNVADATQAQLAQLDDNALVEVEVNGEKVTIPWKDARNGIMRQQDYTRKTQAIKAQEQSFAEQQAQFTEKLTQLDALTKLVSNPELLAGFVKLQYPQLLGQANQVDTQNQVDLEDVPTIGQVQQTLAQSIQQLKQEMLQEIQQQSNATTQEIQLRAEAAKLGTEINSTIKGLFDSAPFISKVVPQAEDVLRFEVLKLKPQTAEETIQAFKDVFAGWVESYQEAVRETTKTNITNKEKLLSNNIQPAGGIPPQPKPTTFVGKDNKIDWNKLSQAAMELMK